MASQGERLLWQNRVHVPRQVPDSPMGWAGGCRQRCRALRATMDARSQGTPVPRHPSCSQRGHPGMQGPARAVPSTAQTHPRGPGAVPASGRHHPGEEQLLPGRTAAPAARAGQKDAHGKQRGLKSVWEDRLLSPGVLLSVTTRSIK